MLLVFAWLLPIVRETRSHNPNAAERALGLAQYSTDLVVHSASSYHLAPGFVARAGAIVVAALVLMPLAGLAGRRRWSAFVLGGTVLLLALELPSFVFPHFSSRVVVAVAPPRVRSVSFALAGGAAVLVRLAGPFVLPAALASGIALQLEFPGDFGTKLQQGGPAVATWIAFWGGLAGLAVATALVRSGRGGRFERPGPFAALAVLRVVAALSTQRRAQSAPPTTTARHALSP